METKPLQAVPSTAPIGFLIPSDTRPQAAHARATIALDDITSIGRDESCRLHLSDPCVSARHARIERKPTGWSIRDLGSRNGTFVNGGRIIEAVLSPNDKIRVGESVFTFSENVRESSAPRSRNHEWNEALLRVPAFAKTDFPVLLTGPSGSGKDLLANWIHSGSRRSKGPFVSINCSALSENLVESELFGHVRGSFTGAMSDRKGAFESARGGTLFLDEIGDLPLALQPKLLRALENHEIKPVGSDRSVETDVRIVAATHRDLSNQVRRGAFRDDLYYRLCVCAVRAPALADRMEDFEELLYSFAKELRVRFSFGAIEALKEHAWPGNVRELRNTVQRAAAYFPSQQVTREDVAALIVRDRVAPEASYLAESGVGVRAGTQGQLIKELERDIIVRRLVANRGNQRQTAADLGLPKSTLHDRIRTYGIDLHALLGDSGQFSP